MEFDSPDAFLAHVLWTFHSYLDRLVLVGGFAVRLYALHPRAAPTACRMLRTFDADLAVANSRIPLASQSLAVLADAAGFQPDFRGDHVPPVMKFIAKGTHVGSRGVDQYTVEFLTPMTGAPIRRGGKAVVTSDIQAGVTAQNLRYLDLLLERPWHVSLATLPGISEEARTIEVAVPHPG
ncbi:MAG: nucleotidyltransferase domain-containing protein [bacterium]|uniref:Nucleotidyltransferase domain-containing protein n=1 Tax=Candidatus Methylomirabilis tolerans TaxID=3123416 RepID=A0AAJ1AGD8_9BACT|nr:nucleotidyltransferase domain-containing protein [Candidatus Methylomirabilis sp.]